jgi:hypothetical protein
VNYLYPIPGSQINATSFVADSTHILGDLDMGVDELDMLSVDYTKVVPAITITGFSFRVTPGGMPELQVIQPSITANVLSFSVSGGIAGKAYTLEVIAKQANATRSDILNINLLGDDCDCCVVPAKIDKPGLIDGALTFVNCCPRWYVSTVMPATANVMDWWYDPATGDFYIYATNGVTYWWQQIVTGSQGSGATGGGVISLVDPISPNGILATFPLTVNGTAINPTAATTLFVSEDGVWQEAGVDYTVSASNIVFTEPPQADSNIFMVWFGSSTASTILINPIVPDGATTTFSLGSATGPVTILGSTELFVSVDGVWQEPIVQYTAGGNQIIFVDPPAADSNVFMVWVESS